VTFTEQSATFLERLASRKRQPVKPATLRAYRGYTTNWILPRLGDVDLHTFDNGAMKAFADSLTGLGPKSTTEVVSLVKQIVSSAVDTNGNRLYPREWNNEFIDLPVVDKQKQPEVTLEQLEVVMAGKYRTFYALLAGTGLRIGEALAVRIGDDGQHTCWSPSKAAIFVRTAFWQGREQDPKTKAAVRDVDLDPRLNDMLRFWAPPAGASGLFLFRGPAGNHLWESRLYTDSLVPAGVEGFHSFRRYRTTRLRETGTPEEIIRYWIGHASKSVTDRYSKLASNVKLRKQWAAQAGLGFEV